MTKSREKWQGRGHEEKCVWAWFGVCCPISRSAELLSFFILLGFNRAPCVKDTLAKNRKLLSTLQCGSTLTLLLPRCSLLRTCVFVHHYLHFPSWTFLQLGGRSFRFLNCLFSENYFDNAFLFIHSQQFSFCSDWQLTGDKGHSTIWSMENKCLHSRNQHQIFNTKKFERRWLRLKGGGWAHPIVFNQTKIQWWR